MGGGVRRHIDQLVERFRDEAFFLLLMATDRGGQVSVLSLPGHPTLALPADRLDDLVCLLQSMGVSRVHVHHLLGMDLDVQRLFAESIAAFAGVDVVVHTATCSASLLYQSAARHVRPRGAIVSVPAADRVTPAVARQLHEPVAAGASSKQALLTQGSSAPRPRLRKQGALNWLSAGST